MALDVASYQPKDLSALIAQFGAQHVIVKLYQSAEGPTNIFHARAQIASVKAAAGVTVGGYLWLYSSISPARQVQEAVALAEGEGVKLPILWIDVEKYTDGSCPTPAQIQTALDECVVQGVLGGIYSGKYVFESLGNPSFPGVPLWSANYNFKPDLSVPSYGDMVLVGHQFSSTPVDQSVFLPEYTGLS